MPALRRHYGEGEVCLFEKKRVFLKKKKKKKKKDRVIGCDIRRSPNDPTVRYIDLSTPSMLSQMVVENNIDWIFHNASILSAVGERNPDLALKVNVDALNVVFGVARQQSTETNPIRLMVPR